MLIALLIYTTISKIPTKPSLKIIINFFEFLIILLFVHLIKNGIENKKEIE
jgi:hypothetical protein